MLSNYLLNQQKILLIKDQFGLENTSQKIVYKWLTEQKGNDVSLNVLKSLNTNEHPFLLIRVAQLSRNNNPSSIFEFVHQCRKLSAVQYLFLWSTEKNIAQTFLVPYLEHMSDLVLTVEDDKNLSILIKKSGGSISNKHYHYQVLDGCFSVKESKKLDRSKHTSETMKPTIDPASLGTFKIGDLRKEEQEAKDALTLPFEFYKPTADGGKVLYHPDAEDDLDEEDPDDDLLI
ncbi:elongator complex protein 5 [Toxorhynchites rutilus septentrionalis]|uniref:elongator complex protein 5 n=1 Tax=Toxorhynchites rutilus septentrionalis TaxID=329112 RepID=UPI002478DF71|nr:elongator complex protein 5 [Toxorhynchites rutilus septentrionalis]